MCNVNQSLPASRRHWIFSVSGLCLACCHSTDYKAEMPELLIRAFAPLDTQSNGRLGELQFDPTSRTCSGLIQWTLRTFAAPLGALSPQQYVDMPTSRRWHTTKAKFALNRNLAGAMSSPEGFDHSFVIFDLLQHEEKDHMSSRADRIDRCAAMSPFEPHSSLGTNGSRLTAPLEANFTTRRCLCICFVSVVPVSPRSV